MPTEIVYSSMPSRYIQEAWRYRGRVTFQPVRKRHGTMATGVVQIINLSVFVCVCVCVYVCVYVMRYIVYI